MKTELRFQPFHGGLRKPFALGAALMLLAATPAARGASAAELLERGIYTEETKGELKAATDTYRQIVDDPNADRSLVAQAQLRLGLCELKLGNKPQAISSLERLTQRFPDKSDLLELVEPHMPQLLDDIVKQIEQNYIQEVDRNELMETAIRAIAGKLDASGGLLRTNDTEFLSANEVAEMKLNLEQKLGGIGAVLRVDGSTQEIVAQQLLPNSPAIRGGLLAGDRILKINGESCQDMKLQVVVSRLRGEPGTPVSVSVKREGSTQLLELQLVRDVVLLPSVSADRRNADGSWDFMLDAGQGIGYIRLTQVGKPSPEEMKAALDELTARGLKALILDLRNNPGGSLAQAVTIADLFVDGGRIVTVKSRSGEEVHDAKSEGTYGGFPMVVLVNRYTASAAEIIAACLQDHHRATVVGERTFGQGIVRNLFPLQGGKTALKLPVAVYYRPSGKNMNRYPNAKESDEWGVSPDAGFAVALTDEEVKQAQLARAEQAALTGPANSPAEFQDRQLQKALECVAAQTGQQW